MTVTVNHGDCLEIMRAMAAASIDAVVTDPPYHLTSIVKRFGAATAAPAKVGATGAYKRHSTGFMGKKWDGGDVAFRPETWAEVLRVLKPGGHMLCFGGTRTYHRMACAIEDAGFEIRDQIGWLYGSGFPKSHNVAVGIAKKHNPDWETGDPLPPDAEAREGWGTALKPAWEPIVLARKPLIGTVAANVLAHGTGALNIDGCRVEYVSAEDKAAAAAAASQRLGQDSPGRVRWGETGSKCTGFQNPTGSVAGYLAKQDKGRWPATVIHDGSDEVLAEFAKHGELTSGRLLSHHKRQGKSQIGTFNIRDRTGEPCDFGGDPGTAARFFYTAKADKSDRLGSKHPTVKPVDLMAYLVRLVTPPGGTVLDPFAGSGTTGMACLREGFDCVLIEREAEYINDIEARLGHVRGDDTPLFSAARP